MRVYERNMIYLLGDKGVVRLNLDHISAYRAADDSQDSSIIFMDGGSIFTVYESPAEIDDMLSERFVAIVSRK